MAAKVARLTTENALLREEVRIKDTRLARIPPHERPHYEPVERMAILNLRAAAGWNAAETARRFLLTPLTVANWMRRLDEEGAHALVQTHSPVNRFPDFVTELVRALRATLPTMGKVRLAQVLARAGIHLAPTTIRRLAKKRARSAPEPAGGASRLGTSVDRVVRAKYPHHVWHVDLTVVPTLGGFWLPWIPNAVAPMWPFGWWVVIVLDHFSRAVIGHAVFKKQPSADQVCNTLDAAIEKAGRRPRHLVSDRGAQFRDCYRSWCERRGIRPRFGAIGKKGSIAVVERFIRSMKEEHFRRTLVALRTDTVERELAAYRRWYNEARPHASLRGETPLERLQGRTSARDEPGFEPRPRQPLRGRQRVRRLMLVVDHVDGQRHLPVISLREAA